MSLSFLCRTVYNIGAMAKETLIKQANTNARSLDSAELPEKRQFCCARDDRDELNQSLPKVPKRSYNIPALQRGCAALTFSSHLTG